MKIIQITLILIFSFISSSLAKEYIKDNKKTFRDHRSGFIVEWECLCRGLSKRYNLRN
jgi:hypothetical protein